MLGTQVLARSGAREHPRAVSMSRGLQIRSSRKVSCQQVAERFRHLKPVVAESDPNNGAGSVGVLHPHRDEPMHWLAE